MGRSVAKASKLKLQLRPAADITLGQQTATFASLDVSITPLPLLTEHAIPGVCDCTVTSYAPLAASLVENVNAPLVVALLTAQVPTAGYTSYPPQS